MKRFVYAALACTALSVPAYALDKCTPTADDAQVVTCNYAPDQRYLVNAVVGFPVNLKFGDGEQMKRTDFAYSGVDKDGRPAKTWRGPLCGPKEDDKCPANLFQNNLPLWAFQAGHSSLIVVTVKDGAERTYQFDLNATTQPEPNTTYAMNFAYPADVAKAATVADQAKKQEAIAAWQARQAKVKEVAAIARMKQDPFYGVRNWKYQAKADPEFKALQPSEVSDNGMLTEMQWPGNVQIPTVTILDPASGEGRAASTSTDGHMVVIPTTAEWFRLRLGPKAVMDIHNLAWSPVRPDPGTGTTSPDVVRQVIYAGGK